VLHRDADWFGHQVFLYDQWPAGLYGSPGVAGARSAAPIATAWAVLRHLGMEGYLDIGRGLLATTRTFRAAVEAVPELAIVGDPIGPVLAFTATSSALDPAAVGDAMDDRGWHLNRIVDPPGLHVMLSPAHAGVLDRLLDDLRASVADPGSGRGGTVRYA
jgi:glutamate/tyrosine decarboxylase-like PLP-dependent enzyme